VRSIRACTEDGISQIVYYHPGVGTGDFVDRWIGGGTGIGLSENVRSVYAWLLDNYQDCDEIDLPLRLSQPHPVEPAWSVKPSAISS